MTKNQVHEWHETRRNDDGTSYKQYFRGHWDGRQWRFSTTGPEDADWPPVEFPPPELWVALRDVLWRKYQRKRMNYKLIESVDKVLAGLRESGELSAE